MAQPNIEQIVNVLIDHNMFESHRLQPVSDKTYEFRFHSGEESGWFEYFTGNLASKEVKVQNAVLKDTSTADVQDQAFLVGLAHLYNHAKEQVGDDAGKIKVTINSSLSSNKLNGIFNRLYEGRESVLGNETKSLRWLLETGYAEVQGYFRSPRC